MAAGRSERVEALIGRMTLAEKLGQLTMVSADFAVTGPVLSPDYTARLRAGEAGSLLNLWGAEATRAMQRIAVEETRLGIPLLLCFDVVHGQRTIFPIPLGEAASFDPALWEATARRAAMEAARDGIALTFAPMLDVCRDPRWGRIAEAPGEDPFLASRYAEAKLRGFQAGDLGRADAIAATAKHLGAYGGVTAGREYASVDLSERSLHEVHLPAFHAAVDAGVAAIMPSFNDLAGIPVTANAPLLRDLVRSRWGFEGVIISDYGAIGELLAHGVAADLAEAAALALKAGIDIDMMAEAYARGLPAALERGAVTIADIDAAVGRVLTLKEQLGLFDDPYRRGAPVPPDGGLDRELAREAARRSVVLLTNRGDVLPLGPDRRRIALVGPLADAADEMLGSWYGAGRFDDVVTIRRGLAAALPDAVIDHAAGTAISGDDSSGIEAALEIARAADIVLLCIGESAAMSGEAASRARPELPPIQRLLAELVLDLGRPVVVLLSSGRPITIDWLVPRAEAVLATWFLGTEAGAALADILTGRAAPSGRLPVSWPVDVGQIPVFFGERPTGRPPSAANKYSSKYLDLPNEPLFAFGHGLGYAPVVYGEPRLSAAEIRPGGRVTVEIDLANEGTRPAEETVLLFVRDPVASIARPLLELRGFTRVALAPGERRRVALELTASALTFLDRGLAPRLESGLIEVFVGPSAERNRLRRAALQLVAE